MTSSLSLLLNNQFEGGDITGFYFGKLIKKPQNNKYQLHSRKTMPNEGVKITASSLFFPPLFSKRSQIVQGTTS